MPDEPDPELVPTILRHLRDGCTYDEAVRRAENLKSWQKRRKQRRDAANGR